MGNGAYLYNLTILRIFTDDIIDYLSEHFHHKRMYSALKRSRQVDPNLLQDNSTSHHPYFLVAVWRYS